MTAEQIKEMLAIQFEIALNIAKLQTYHTTYQFPNISGRECLHGCYIHNEAYRAWLKKLEPDE